MTRIHNESHHQTRQKMPHKTEGVIEVVFFRCSLGYFLFSFETTVGYLGNNQYRRVGSDMEYE